MSATPASNVSSDRPTSRRPRGDDAADAVLRGVRGGLDEAAREIARDRAAWEGASVDARLPDVGAADAVVDLARRLDHEADFWRGYALLRLRPGAGRALAIGAALVGLAAGFGLAGLGGVRGLVSEGVGAAGLLASSLALAVGVGSAFGVAAWLDRAAASAAREALARADAAERRLQRVAAILALRPADAAAYREALVRLERVP